jgi:hypothetical protein
MDGTDSLQQMANSYNKIADNNQPDAANDMRGAMCEHIQSTMLSSQTSINASNGGS